MRFFLIFFSLFFFHSILLGGEISITCLNGANQRIRVVGFEDQFSLKPILLVDTVTNDSGKVAFRLPCNQILPVEFRTNNCFAKWFLEPDKNYRLGFYLPDSSLSISENNLPEIVLVNLDSTQNCLTDSIFQFEKQLDNFYRLNAPFFVQPRLLANELAKFKATLQSGILLHPGRFLSTYIRYSLAPIEEAAYQNKRAIFRHYFSGPFLFNHPAYVAYFKLYFKKYLWIASNKTSSNFLLNDVNESASIELLDQHLLLHDTLLKNDTLRQMVIIYNLSEIFYDKNFNRNQIEKILNHMARTKAITKDHSTVARNLLSSLTFMDQGSPAPLFDLIDANNQPFQLVKEKGNWVFLSFIACSDQHSMAEIKALQKIAIKYALKIKFIFVVLEGEDDGYKAMQRYIPTGTVLIDDRKLRTTKELYFVKDFPCFVLLDPDLDVYSSKPPMPSDNLEGYFKQVIKKTK